MLYTLTVNSCCFFFVSSFLPLSNSFFLFGLFFFPSSCFKFLRYHVLSLACFFVSFVTVRRYQDAIRVLSQILSFLGRSRSYLTIQGYQQDAMLRMNDRMYHLVMLCNALSPTRLDETIQAHITDHLTDKQYKYV